MLPAALTMQIFFFLQCFFGSVFFLLQKTVLDRYPPLQTTAWGYCMGGALMVLVVAPQATSAADWHIHGFQWLAIACKTLYLSAVGCNSDRSGCDFQM